MVPLPQGGAIPVDLKGAGSSQSVVVNVNMAEGGETESQTEEGRGQEARQLGKNISAAVQRELQNQKRQGGMLNPHGVPGRMNTGQILETAAGKLASKTGKIYKVSNFDDPTSDSSKRVLQELKKAGIPADEILTDGKTGNKFKNKIFTGKQYIMKLRHHVDKKLASRSIGQYDINEQPQGKGAQKAGPDLTYALIAHGAKATLRDMAEIKGRKNDEY